MMPNAKQEYFFYLHGVIFFCFLLKAEAHVLVPSFEIQIGIFVHVIDSCPYATALQEVRIDN